MRGRLLWQGWCVSPAIDCPSCVWLYTYRGGAGCRDVHWLSLALPLTTPIAVAYFAAAHVSTLGRRRCRGPHPT
ncbi:hypothetical protein BD309DRAFT_245727 [Dichomitus squalens]|nr:hypothetical protein BD309DRAFT_245727 [Dichomitus squalens]